MNIIVDEIEKFLECYNSEEHLEYIKSSKSKLMDLCVNDEFKELIKNGPILAKCTLDYPFEKPYTFGVLVDTLKHVFEQIWGQLIYMYCTVVEDKEISGLINKSLYSEKFGRAIHILDDLVPEGLYYDFNKNELIIHIGS